MAKKLYEGMFLVDSVETESGWEGVNKDIKKVLKKAKADIVSLEKWDNRRLAYDVDGKNRGTYILCYFEAPGEGIKEIERSVQLSESIMRVLILSTERMSKEDMEKETPLKRVEKRVEKRPPEEEKVPSKPESEEAKMELEVPEESVATIEPESSELAEQQVAVVEQKAAEAAPAEPAEAKESSESEEVQVEPEENGSEKD
ncbi:MAG: 30S ribosomal protein S6 [Sedimentisphaerales bacterium]|nr:30S ribosomal protein S6 [Sedimentisphaerales bacterium]